MSNNGLRAATGLPFDRRIIGRLKSSGRQQRRGETMAEKRLTGRIARDNIKLMEVPRPPQGVVQGFLALGDDSTGIISDVMDELGIPSGVVGAHILRPTIAGSHMVGPALTVRNVLQRADALEGARAKVNKMAEFEAHNLASPGDVLVIDGVSGMSNMGGISAQTGKRQGEAGAVVFGGVRDVGHSRGIGYPIWSSELVATTGKWRLQTIEINGSVQIGGVRVEPGDLVVADATSVCFIPRDRVLEVLELAQEKRAAEAIRCKAIDDGMPVPDLARATYGEKG
jgi:4-hydroxy-4-methyl-2-oxoglutarate aldolase